MKKKPKGVRGGKIRVTLDLDVREYGLLERITEEIGEPSLAAALRQMMRAFALTRHYAVPIGAAKFVLSEHELVDLSLAFSVHPLVPGVPAVPTAETHRES